MLRKIRLTLAALIFTAVTLLFLDFTGTLHAWLGWMAKIQFLPALLAVNVGVVLFLVVLTWVFGRVYCSIICPLGVMQDVISWLNGRRKKKKYRFSYSPAKSWLRNSILVLYLAALVAGAGSLIALLAPYSSYGRIVSNLFAPIYQWGNNALAYLAERADSYAFYEVTVWLKSLPTFLIAAATFVIIALLAWRGGRTYCNTICPVGTLLGLISRYSLLRITIDEEKKTASVYLKPDQVSLAIGKGGLNIRLSKMLTGYDIDVYREIEEEDVALTEFADEIDGWVIDALKACGCDTAKSVLELPVEEIAARADLELEQAQKVVEILKAEFEE